MKTLKILLLVIFGSLTFSCGDDNNEKLQLSSGFFKQTKWSGTFEWLKDGELNFEDNVNIYFLTENRGSFSFNSSLVSSFNFNYIVDDKLLRIECAKTSNEYVEIMSGDWILTEIKNDKLSFIKGIVNDKNHYIIKLIKDKGRQGKS